MARAVRSGSRADTAILAVCTLLSLLATVVPNTLRETIAGGLRRTVVSPLLSLQKQAELLRGAFVAREATAQRIDSLALRAATLAELEYENERLRKIIGLGAGLKWGFVPAEALHGGGLADEHTIVLTAGSNAGVKVNSAVVAPDGLVGMVLHPDPTMSIALMWTHADFRASAMSAEGSAFGIIHPHLGDEPERYLLELRSVAFRDVLKPGTLITTSGLGGVYPRGIPIGTVLRELKTTEGWARAYLVRPAVRPPDVTSVMVLLPERVSAGVTGVWASPALADSAARRISAAGDSAIRKSIGDSLTKEAALSVIASRDSITRDSIARVDSVSRDSLRRRP